MLKQELAKVARGLSTVSLQVVHVLTLIAQLGLAPLHDVGLKRFHHLAGAHKSSHALTIEPLKAPLVKHCHEHFLLEKHAPSVLGSLPDQITFAEENR